MDTFVNSVSEYVVNGGDNESFSETLSLGGDDENNPDHNMENTGEKNKEEGDNLSEKSDDFMDAFSEESADALPEPEQSSDALFEPEEFEDALPDLEGFDDAFSEIEYQDIDGESDSASLGESIQPLAEHNQPSETSTDADVGEGNELSGQTEQGENEQEGQAVPSMVDVKVTAQEKRGDRISVTLDGTEIEKDEPSPDSDAPQGETDGSSESAVQENGENQEFVAGQSQATSQADDEEQWSVTIPRLFSQPNEEELRAVASLRLSNQEDGEELEYITSPRSTSQAEEKEPGSVVSPMLTVHEGWGHDEGTASANQRDEERLGPIASSSQSASQTANQIDRDQLEAIVGPSQTDDQENREHLEVFSGPGQAANQTDREQLEVTADPSRSTSQADAESVKTNSPPESPTEQSGNASSSRDGTNYSTSTEWKLESDDSKSIITPRTTKSVLKSEEKLKPSTWILKEMATSLSEKYEDGILSPEYDYISYGGALLKELDQEMKRQIRENANEMFSRPIAQSNDRIHTPDAKFFSMEEFLDQHLNLNLNIDLSDTPISMTEEKRASIVAMTVNDKRLYRWHNSIDELLKTEESYTRDLYVLCTYFFRILQSVNYITEEEKDTICRNGETIAKDQEDFCDSLREAVTCDKAQLSVRNTANCFIKAGNYFEAYFDYSMRHDKATTVYNKLVQTNPEFRDLNNRLHLFHRVSWGTNKLEFKDYLIMPFQRLFRYKLLLQSLEKSTPLICDGYELLETAIDTIHSVATKIDDSKARVELEIKSEIFLSRLQGTWGVSERWYKHFGSCALIGTLEMRYLPKQRVSKRVCCALFEYYLILVKPRKPDVYEPKQWFPIREFLVEDLTDMPTSVNFPWLLRNNSHIFEFSAVSEAEKDIWMTGMTNCIKSAKEHHTMSKTNPNEYLAEHLFMSSLDIRGTNKLTEISPEVNLDSKPAERIAIPSGSTSFSQSAMFNKPSRSMNRLSIPSFPSMFYLSSDNMQSPTSGRYLFRGALSDKFVSYKLKQFKTRCDIFDANFKDVYTSCLITSKGSHKKKSS